MIAYYLGARILFGSGNYYVGSILSGLTGGIWGVGSTNSYQIYRSTKNTPNENWYSVDAYNKRLQFCSKIIVVFFVMLIIEIVVIWFFGL